MHSATVNISFSKKLLKQMDRVAKEEARSRSELLREAARRYVEFRKASLLKLVEPSFEFWNNPKDAVYDRL
jgi:metal-responsive CopG/Arc/MetJ family transcriptional regulator